MAIKEQLPFGGRGFKITLDTSGSEDIVLGNIGSPYAGSWYLKYVPGGASPSTFIPKCRPTGSGLSGASLDTMIYFTIDSSTAVAAGTSISTDNTFIIPCDGQDLILTATGATNGGTIYAVPVIGA